MRADNITTEDTHGAPAALRAQLQFLTWLKNTHPTVMDRALQATRRQSGAPGLGAYSRSPYRNQVEGAPGMSGFMDSIIGGISHLDFSKLTDNVMKAGTGLLAYSSQKKLLKLNLDRAKRGLPPLDASEYGQAPVIRSQIDLDPELADGLARGFTSYGLPLIAGLAALFFFTRRGRR